MKTKQEHSSHEERGHSKLRGSSGQGTEVRRGANSGSCGHFSAGGVEGVEGQVAGVVLKKSPAEDSGGWGAGIGDVRGGDRREEDKENSEEWMLGNFKSWLIIHCAPLADFLIS